MKTRLKSKVIDECRRVLGSILKGQFTRTSSRTCACSYQPDVDATGSSPLEAGSSSDPDGDQNRPLNRLFSFQTPPVVQPGSSNRTRCDQRFLPQQPTGRRNARHKNNPTLATISKSVYRRNTDWETDISNKTRSCLRFIIVPAPVCVSAITDVCVSATDFNSAQFSQNS